MTEKELRGKIDNGLKDIGFVEGFINRSVIEMVVVIVKPLLQDKSQ